jgi:hypothetical protein
MASDAAVRRSARLNRPPTPPPEWHEITHKTSKKAISSRRGNAATPAVQKRASGLRKSSGKSSTEKEKEKRGVKRKRLDEEEEELPPSKEELKLESRRASLEKWSKELEERERQIEKRAKIVEDLAHSAGSFRDAMTKQRAEELVKKLDNTFTCAL